jgi:hypothetical protein
MTTHRLWFTSDRRRFWIVPEDAPLPLGPLRVRSFRLAARDIDPEAIASYAVSAAEAATFIDDLLGATLRETAQGALGDDVDPLELLGASVGAFLTDPDAVRDSMSGLRQRLSSVAERARVPDDVPARLWAQVGALDDALRDDDSELAQRLAKLEQRVEQALPSVTERLQGLAAKLAERARGASERRDD